MTKKRRRDSDQLKNATLADFNLDLGIDVPTASISISHRSQDQRRVHRRSVPTAPISPIKGNNCCSPNPPLDDDADWVDEPGGYLSEGTTKVGVDGERRSGKRYIASVSFLLRDGYLALNLWLQDYPNVEWIKHRNKYLAYLMTVKGRGYTSNEFVCRRCPEGDIQAMAEYRCADCWSMELVCRECCVHLHADHPLCRIQVCCLFLYVCLIAETFEDVEREVL